MKILVTMKHVKFVFFLVFFICMSGKEALAYDAKINGVYYYFSGMTAEVTCECPPYVGGPEGNRLTYFGNLIIPESVIYNGTSYVVTSIGDHAFWGCSDLLSITIPNTVTSIGQKAFYDCTSLESITFGTGLLTIGRDAFSNSGVFFHRPAKVIWLANTPPIGYKDVSGIMNYVANDTYTELSNKTVYPFLSSMFEVDGVKYVPVSPSERTCDIIDCQYNESAEHVIIGKSVVNKGISLMLRNIQPYSFYGNKHIRSVSVETGYIGNIPQYCFSGCEGIESAIISNQGNVEEKAFYNSAISSPAIFSINNQGDINESAFEGCSGVTSVTISNCGDIGEKAFFGSATSDLATFVINNQGNIASSAFAHCSSMITAELGENICSIGEKAFLNCFKLERISIPDAVSFLGASAFQGCTSLISAKTGDGISVLNKLTFGNCTSLTNIEIGAGVNIIDGAYDYPDSYGCFSNCSSLQEIKIPQNMVVIKDYVFKGCRNLKKIVIEEKTDDNNVEPLVIDLPEISIDNNNPGNTINETLDVFYLGYGDVLSFDYKMGGGDPAYGYFSVYLDGEEIVKENGDKAGTYSIQFSKGGHVKILARSFLSSLVGTHGYVNASIYNVRLTKSKENLTLGSNGSSPLFGDCPLDEAYIGRKIFYDQTSNYGSSPFFRISSLRSVIITDKETEISEKEFYGCSSLKEVKIGNGVTSIGEWAFSGCSSLDSFSFGLSVESIGKEAFSDCTALTKLISYAADPPTCGGQALDDINKWNCTLSVPKGCASTYQKADQWKEFFYIEEGEPSYSVISGDANGNGNVDENDINAIVDYMMNGKTEGFVFDNADMNGDQKVNATDIVQIVNIIKVK